MSVIKAVISELGLNAAQFAKSIGVHPTQIYDLQTGKTKAISPAMADKIISTYPEFTKAWLLTGEGDMYANNEPKPEISYTDGVPYYDEMFECGFNELVAPNSESPEYLIKMPGYEKATLWCNASGASMEPEISNGDIIAMRRIEDFSFLPYGDIYAFITSNGMRTIKRLGRSSDPTCYRLIPTNKEYDEQDIPKNMIQIVYRVLGAMKAF